MFCCSPSLPWSPVAIPFRSIETFIKVNRRRLNTAFGLRWQVRRRYRHRYILQGLDTRPSSGSSAATPLVCGMPNRSSAAQHRAGREHASAKSSTTSTTARPPNCCTHSTSKPAWSWPTSISRKVQRNPRRAAVTRRTRGRALHRHADAMHCQKKPSRPPQGTGSPDRSTEGQSANSAAKCPSRLRFRRPASSATPPLPPGTAGMKPGPPMYSAPHAPWPEPSGNP